MRYANFNGVDLRNANLSGADLSGADLSGADLSGADLSGTIIFYTDLSRTKNLTQQQLEGDKPPLICDSLFPEDIEINTDKNCDTLFWSLLHKYRFIFNSFEDAEFFLCDKEAFCNSLKHLVI